MRVQRCILQHAGRVRDSPGTEGKGDVYLFHMLKLEIPLQGQLSNRPLESLVHEGPPDVASIVSGLHSGHTRVKLAFLPHAGHDVGKLDASATCDHVVCMSWKGSESRAGKGTPLGGVRKHAQSHGRGGRRPSCCLEPQALC